LSKYANNDKIDVLISETNLGFARGMNLGYRFALEKYKPSFIALLNNDVVLEQKDFYTQTIKEYNYSHFAVLGPMIITADGKRTSSPIIDPEIKKELIRKRYLGVCVLYYIELLRLHWLISVKRKFIKSERMSKANSYSDGYYLARHEDVVVQGSCLILSTEFSANFKNGLDESTFLFHEEEILYLYVHSKKLKMIYNPDLYIYHKEDSATNSMILGERKKTLFKLKHLKKSGKELMRIYKKLECDSLNSTK
jgi:GT2 family glycosyltransferase